MTKKPETDPNPATEPVVDLNPATEPVVDLSLATEPVVDLNPATEPVVDLSLATEPGVDPIPATDPAPETGFSYDEILANDVQMYKTLIDEISTSRYLPQPEMEAFVDAKIDLIGGGRVLTDDRCHLQLRQVQASGYNLANALENWGNAARRALLEMGQ